MARTLQSVCRASLAAGFCLVLGACSSTPAKPKFRSFVPPPLRGVLPSPAPVPELTAVTLEPSLSISPESNLPNRGRLPARPSNPQFLMDKAERLFADGKKAVQEGRNRDARRAFDEAIQVMMSEPLPSDPVERRRLSERLDDLADAIYHYYVEQLGAGVP